MKIKRLFEKLSDGVFDYIDDLNDRVDGGIFNWISTVSKDTKLKEYAKLSEFNPTLIAQKNFKFIEKYRNIDKEIFKKYAEIRKLEKSKEKLELEMNNEVLIKFQDELINTDFESFYKIFMGDEEEYWDIHPTIMKKYSKMIDLIRKTKKYNL